MLVSQLIGGPATRQGPGQTRARLAAVWAVSVLAPLVATLYAGQPTETTEREKERERGQQESENNTDHLTFTTISAVF